VVGIGDEAGEAVGTTSQGYTLLSGMTNDWSAVCRGLARKRERFCRDDKLRRGGVDNVGGRAVGVYAVPSTP
jgi:hypothetical protein